MTDPRTIAAGLKINERTLTLRIGALQPVVTADLLCETIKPSNVAGFRQRHKLLVENPKLQGYRLTELGEQVCAILQEQDHD